METSQLATPILINIFRGTRFKKIVFNDAYAKLLIIVGGLKWYDLPHLHHPLIHLRINLEYRKELKLKCLN